MAACVVASPRIERNPHLGFHKGASGIKLAARRRRSSRSGVRLSTFVCSDMWGRCLNLVGEKCSEAWLGALHYLPKRFRTSASSASSPDLPRMLTYFLYDSAEPALFIPSRARPW